MLRENKNAINIQPKTLKERLAGNFKLNDENQVPSPREPVPLKLKQFLNTQDSADIVKPRESVISRIPRISINHVLSKNNNITNIRALKLPLKIEPKIEKPESPGEIEDIDKTTGRDAVFLVSDLAKDIYSYMYSLEEAQSIQDDYLKDQKIFTPKVRRRLVNWCIEVHNALELLPETLYITVAIIDRYFERCPVTQQNQIMLVAISAALIASKYEEIYIPTISDFLKHTEFQYSKTEVLRMEIRILEKLEFNLGKPIPLAFLRRFSKAAHCDLNMHSIAKFIMELSLSEYECSHWRPSLLAAAALFTTISLLHRSDSNWTRSLVHHTRYSKKDLSGPVTTLCQILKKAHKSSRSFYCVKKNQHSWDQWKESTLRSTRVDELIRQSNLLH